MKHKIEHEDSGGMTLRALEQFANAARAAGATGDEIVVPTVTISGRRLKRVAVQIEDQSVEELA